MSKSYVEEFLDQWAHAYQESNRVHLHWMEEEFKKANRITKKEQDVTENKHNDKGVSKNTETQELRSGSDDGDSKFNISNSHRQGAPQDNERGNE